MPEASPAPARRPRRWRAALLASAILAALAAVLLLRPAPELEVVAPELREVVDLVIVSGKLRAVRQAQVGVEVAGTLATIAVREGDRVSFGQTLARVAQTDFDSQEKQALARVDAYRGDLASAAATLAQADLDLRRGESLSRAAVLTGEDLDRARLSHTRAQAQLSAAEARLREAELAVEVLRRQAERREVRAPFAGIITRRQAEPGQSVLPGEAILTLDEMDTAEVYVEADENNLSRLRVGQPARIYAPSFRHESFAARLSQIGPRVDWDRGVVGLRLTPEQLPAWALPNMTVDANIEVARIPSALTLPASAVLRAADGTASVLAAEEDGLKRRPVRILGQSPATLSIEGLAPGTLVALRAAEAREGRRYRWVRP